MKSVHTFLKFSLRKPYMMVFKQTDAMANRRRTDWSSAPVMKRWCTIIIFLFWIPAMAELNPVSNSTHLLAPRSKRTWHWYKLTPGWFSCAFFSFFRWKHSYKCYLRESNISWIWKIWLSKIKTCLALRNQDFNKMFTLTNLAYMNATKADGSIYWTKKHVQVYTRRVKFESQF